MRGRVLVVDDDVALAEMLGIVLRGEGFDPVFCADGGHALQAFRDSRPDIILLDLMLPGMDGIDVCRAIRNESGVPIVMLTAKNDTVDVVLGLDSSGLHSNGLTLARRLLAPGEALDLLAARPTELGGASVGDELLRPTRIYVREVMALVDAGIDVHGLAHITGDGLLNLLRVDAPGIGFRLDSLPEPPAIFRLVASRGGIDAAEMYTTFNMGVGFCVVVPEAEATRAIELVGAEGTRARVIGRAVDDPDRRMVLPGPGLAGTGKAFHPVD